jgi:hypothetical protein
VHRHVPSGYVHRTPAESQPVPPWMEAKLAGQEAAFGPSGLHEPPGEGAMAQAPSSHARTRLQLISTWTVGAFTVLGYSHVAPDEEQDVPPSGAFGGQMGLQERVPPSGATVPTSSGVTVESRAPPPSSAWRASCSGLDPSAFGVAWSSPVCLSATDASSGEAAGDTTFPHAAVPSAAQRNQSPCRVIREAPYSANLVPLQVRKTTMRPLAILCHDVHAVRRNAGQGPRSLADQGQLGACASADPHTNL